MRYQLLRNATAVIEYGGRRFVIDPAFDDAGARPPVENTPNQKPNPLVPMPEGWRDAISGIDAAIITHLHRDHFDDAAVEVLDPALPLLCQPEDVERLGAHGFTDLRPVGRAAVVGDIEITRTGGQHGTGEIGAAMAPVSGFVFRTADEPTMYLAGDTIWCEEVADAIATYAPEVIIVNASGARFLEGDPIVMTAEDIARVHASAPEAMLVVVHLEAINHCLETRDHYRARLPALGVHMERVQIPDDGEAVRW